MGLGISETDHQMLTHWEAERLGFVFQFEGEDPGVP